MLELHEGRWRPAVPLAYQGMTLLGRRKLVCWASVPDAPYGVLTARHCGAKFKGPDAQERYEEHYRREHLR